jgi:hypothetical protein
MSDDAQTPGAREHTTGGTPPVQPPAGQVWPAPADGGAGDTVPQDGALVDIGDAPAPAPPEAALRDTSPGTPDPWAAPGERAPSGGPGSDGRDAAGTAGGRSDTIPSGASLPWSAPTAPSVHDQQTVTSFPAMGESAPATHPTPSWAGPATPSSAHGAAANPFAPPAVGEPVPPPPIGPDGPGRVPYGYPGGYATAPGPAGYAGWSGAAPLPSNGMGVSGMVLGIISAAVFCLWPVAILLGVLAMIFGGIGRAKANRGEATNAGQALAGIICGAVGSALGVALGVLVLVT